MHRYKQTPPIIMCFDLKTGEEIHILDSFKSQKSNRTLYKWRRAVVIAMEGTEIEIHFVGWRKRWDETIDISKQPHRVRLGDEVVPRGHVDANGDSESARREKSQCKAQPTDASEAFDQWSASEYPDSPPKFETLPQRQQETIQDVWEIAKTAPNKSYMFKIEMAYRKNVMWVKTQLAAQAAAEAEASEEESDE